MAYDMDLADRLRALLAQEPDIVEKKMFGGLAFLVAGHLAVSASGRGGLLVRVDPSQTEALLTEPAAQPFVMRGREMAGWIHVEVGSSVRDDELDRWVGHALRYIRSLPPK
jgi:hypothetical protein